MREAVDAAIRRGDVRGAVAGLGRLFREQPTAASAAFVNARFEEIRDRVEAVPLRLAILRSFTIEPLLPLLRARCWIAGIDLVAHVGDFNTIDQDLLDAGSHLYRFHPDVTMIAALTSDVAPALWTGSGGRGGAFHADVAHAKQRVREWVAAFRRHTSGSLVVQSFEQPAYAGAGILDAQNPDGQRHAIDALNADVCVVAREYRAVYILDYDALVARHGRSRWRDPHKYLSMRVPLRPEAFGWLADEYMRFLHLLAGKTCKVVVVDLDDTLWGGVVGEVGVAGVQVGAEYPGSAYLECQRELKALSARGVLLAIASKNDAKDAMAVLTERREMLLRPDDFAAMRINWDDKAASLRAIAAELNVGLDAIAFVDDNPVEREWVRTQLPEVHVIELPPDPVLYADALRESPVFERLAVSDEDLARGRQYAEQRQRAAAERTTGSVEDFLASLEMKASIEALAPDSVTRVAQLTQKTNQFNLTTTRYTEAAVAQLATEPDTFVKSIRVSDRFGDNGLVGVAIARLFGHRCEVGTFLLSCRVIGRQVETALLADVAAEARRRGADVLCGWYRPTPKNAPARDFYPKHGFTKTREEDGAIFWELDMARTTIAPPGWILPR